MGTTITGKGNTMAIENPREVFTLMLSNVRQNEERATRIFQELSQIAQDPDVKEVLDARAYVHEKILGTLDQCFKLIGEQPAKTTGRLQEGARGDPGPGCETPLHLI
jgi:ferritin-like metal-binding protein YciE